MITTIAQAVTDKISGGGLQITAVRSYLQTLDRATISGTSVVVMPGRLSIGSPVTEDLRQCTMLIVVIGEASTDATVDALVSLAESIADLFAGQSHGREHLTGSAYTTAVEMDATYSPENLREAGLYTAAVQLTIRY